MGSFFIAGADACTLQCTLQERIFRYSTVLYWILRFLEGDYLVNEKSPEPLIYKGFRGSWRRSRDLNPSGAQHALLP